jgi:flagellar biosynthesis/type III secretory pathway protein FliH
MRGFQQGIDEGEAAAEEEGLKKGRVSGRTATCIFSGSKAGQVKLHSLELFLISHRTAFQI